MFETRYKNKQQLLVAMGKKHNPIRHGDFYYDQDEQLAEFILASGYIPPVELEKLFFVDRHAGDHRGYCEQGFYSKVSSDNAYPVLLKLLQSYLIEFELSRLKDPQKQKTAMDRLLSFEFLNSLRIYPIEFQSSIIFDELAIVEKTGKELAISSEHKQLGDDIPHFESNDEGVHAFLNWFIQEVNQHAPNKRQYDTIKQFCQNLTGLFGFLKDRKYAGLHKLLNKICELYEKTFSSSEHQFPQENLYTATYRHKMLALTHVRDMTIKYCTETNYRNIFPSELKLPVVDKIVHDRFWVYFFRVSQEVQYFEMTDVKKTSAGEKLALTMLSEDKLSEDLVIKNAFTDRYSSELIINDAGELTKLSAELPNDVLQALCDKNSIKLPENIRRNIAEGRIWHTGYTSYENRRKGGKVAELHSQMNSEIFKVLADLDKAYRCTLNVELSKVPTAILEAVIEAKFPDSVKDAFKKIVLPVTTGQSYVEYTQMLSMYEFIRSFQLVSSSYWLDNVYHNDAFFNKPSDKRYSQLGEFQSLFAAYTYIRLHHRFDENPHRFAEVIVAEAIEEARQILEVEESFDELTLTKLDKNRRKFALKYHPDKVLQDDREADDVYRRRKEAAQEKFLQGQLAYEKLYAAIESKKQSMGQVVSQDGQEKPATTPTKSPQASASAGSGLFAISAAPATNVNLLQDIIAQIDKQINRLEENSQHNSFSMFPKRAAEKESALNALKIELSKVNNLNFEAVSQIINKLRIQYPQLDSGISSKVHAFLEQMISFFKKGEDKNILFSTYLEKIEKPEGMKPDTLSLSLN